mmetsp:Transcript_28807/g.81264  ORF Transcript_28807/g.81264 Transcript_28807/m.81264 type:complete len:496 (+) Transcript_28807:452-1939(+)|eukprot:CAMPEP_0119551272 /NCGR_PEP_ID=MMETSP1352-20130426/4568_1 /TAXON_ID=265584 /ORGANISM="Stauroneis constricta, Strain CCMP1120" /LENGTH=495 /DNA_ID=CAMNT_0007597293 /DNA_START=419 /DNA_END=1906 /DNA_ORIENTATION=+
MSDEQDPHPIATKVFNNLGWTFLDKLSLEHDMHFRLVLEDPDDIRPHFRRSCTVVEIARMLQLARYYKAHRNDADWHEDLTQEKLDRWERRQLAPPPPQNYRIYYSVYDKNYSQDEKFGMRYMDVSPQCRLSDLLQLIRPRHSHILSNYPIDALSIQLPRTAMLDAHEATPGEYHILDQNMTTQDLMQQGYQPSYDSHFRVVTPLVSANNPEMFRFFNDTKIEDLDFHRETNLVKIPGMLSWTSTHIEHIYWRDCYTYALCSLIGGMCTPNRSFVLPAFIVSGHHGTGKSILGVLVALFLNQCFGWTVNYYANNGTECTMKPTKETANGKVVDIHDVTSTSRYVVDCSNHILVFTPILDAWQKWKPIMKVRCLCPYSGSYLSVGLYSEEESRDYLAALRTIERCSPFDVERVAKLTVGGDVGGRNDIIDEGSETFSGVLKEMRPWPAYYARPREATVDAANRIIARYPAGELARRHMADFVEMYHDHSEVGKMDG